MERNFKNKTVVKVDKENQLVTLSIRVTDNVVNTYRFTISEFNILVSEYQSGIYTGIDGNQNNIE